MKEERTHHRVPYRVKLWCYRYFNDIGELIKLDKPIQMDVFDVSLGGLGVITRKKLPDNATLEFTLYLEEIPYQVMTQIKWVNSNDIFNRYGLEIIGHNNMLFRHLQQFVNGRELIKA